MPYGTGPLLRQALVRASPRQRVLIAAAMVGGGLALVLVGHVAGALLAVSGVVLLGGMVRTRLRRPPPGRRPELGGGQLEAQSPRNAAVQVNDATEATDG